MTFDELNIGDLFYDEAGCDYVKVGLWTAKCLTTEDGVVGFMDTETFYTEHKVTKCTMIQSVHEHKEE